MKLWTLAIAEPDGPRATIHTTEEDAYQARERTNRFATVEEHEIADPFHALRADLRHTLGVR